MVLVSSGGSPSVIFDRPPSMSGPQPIRGQYLGMLGDTPCYAAEVAGDHAVPEGSSFSGVRDLYGKIPDHELALAAYAVRILAFDRNTRFCGRCGHETRPLRTERAKLCTDCNLITYPRISPAIIVLIRNGDRVLLARSPGFPGGIFSVIAGFVEPNESIEETVHREVREEVGIRVKNIRYFGSEPWPFPDSLMLGFVADYAGGEIVIDKNEIEAAGWFDRENLPNLPSPMSISRALINAWIAREL
jgi:NAD+ diphosphatase